MLAALILAQDAEPSHLPHEVGTCIKVAVPARILENSRPTQRQMCQQIFFFLHSKLENWESY